MRLTTGFYDTACAKAPRITFNMDKVMYMYVHVRIYGALDPTCNKYCDLIG